MMLAFGPVAQAGSGVDVAQRAGLDQASAPAMGETHGQRGRHPGIVAAADEGRGTGQIIVRQLRGHAEAVRMGRRHQYGAAAGMEAKVFYLYMRALQAPINRSG